MDCVREFHVGNGIAVADGVFYTFVRKTEPHLVFLERQSKKVLSGIVLSTEYGCD
jgi:hypothetical protein